MGRASSCGGGCGGGCGRKQGGSVVGSGGNHVSDGLWRHYGVNACMKMGWLRRRFERSSQTGILIRRHETMARANRIWI